MSEQPTPTMFRKFSNGDIIALFIQEPADLDPYNCLSYMRVGQHGTADLLGNIQMTMPAQPLEYKPLLDELQSIGYVIAIRHRSTENDFTKRMEVIQL